MRSCVSNGLVVDPAAGTAAIGSVWIQEGRIAAVTYGQGAAGPWPEEDQGFRRVDARGKWIAPGLVDLHVHFREPGFEEKEDILSGSRAAARGGVTTVCCMPNTRPVTDGGAVVEYIAGKAREAGLVNVLPVGAMSLGQEGKSPADLRGMAAAESRAQALCGRGIAALSEDGKSLVDAGLCLRVMREARELGVPVFSHAEDPGLPGSALGEELMVARDLLLAKESGCRLHFCHISSRGSIEMIRRAKEAGLSVTAETAPHYFMLSQREQGEDGNRKMNPPLRTPEDVEALREALREGVLDVIATDHAPHRRDEKEVSFSQALNGVVGLETSFGAAYTALVATGLLSPLQLIQRMSATPARVIGADRGSLAVGKVADLSLFDVEEEYEVRSADFLSKGKNSPFLGMRLRGRAVLTMVEGRIVWEEKR